VGILQHAMTDSCFSTKWQ